MKTQILILITMVLTAATLTAQQTITVDATSYDISDNLDLEAVAYLFGESKNLEVFERKLNDPELQISNLDLNNDGYIDYLRVIELKKGKVSAIIIQSVLGKDLYQDVATIDVEVKNKKTVYVQVVGNEYIYGYNYIIEPVYVHRPIIFDFFWHPRRVVWYSPYYWNYYPVYYSYRNPRAVYVYHHHVYEHYHHRMHCSYVPQRKIHTAVVLHQTVYRNDYAKSQPNKSFTERNNGLENRQELSARRSASPNTQSGTNPTKAIESNNRRLSPEMKSTTTDTRSGQRTTEKRVTVKADQSSSKSTPGTSDRRYTRTANPTESGNVNRTERKSTTATSPARVSTQTDKSERIYRASSKNSAPTSVRTNSSEKSSSVSTARQISAPAARNEVKISTPARSETRQSAPQRNEVRQSTPAPRARSVSQKATSSSPKNSSTPARSSSVKPSEKSKPATNSPSRSSSEKQAEQSRSASRR